MNVVQRLLVKQAVYLAKSDQNVSDLIVTRHTITIEVTIKCEPKYLYRKAAALMSSKLRSNVWRRYWLLGGPY
jgi:hypothetical protein